ncbi:dihydroneopterin aldolase [Parapedobacter sp. ISTM3]|uniref:dihydroneopterin aldolase n=1 Tax=Parapedobacter sp. ISTM3 TaxID=2800130 RepID=UPI001903861B|nr:dihydroneopterin aldolase [Parapedobacter sp. ISTM3]MBK1440365.1 dihydroneopterin aldolase [Parapedobacter sp. ISTM3]
MEHVRRQVALTDLRFFAYHGFYPEEQVLGNEFTVALYVGFTGAPKDDDNLANTVNYEVLYGIAKSEMQHPRKLLETVAEAILSRIVQKFPFIEDAKISITKRRPPFGGDQAHATVTLVWQQNE